uniref:Uncharacterized protein n=1 Tax=Trichogramma kaykai TaxID=54128 RepID=A0ABD2VSP1_9HYME
MPIYTADEIGSSVAFKSMRARNQNDCNDTPRFRSSDIGLEKFALGWKSSAAILSPKCLPACAALRTRDERLSYPEVPRNAARMILQERRYTSIVVYRFILFLFLFF